MDRAQLVGLSKLAEHTERFDEMLTYIRQLVQQFTTDFTEEERTLLSIAFKQAVAERRNAWRVVKSCLDRERQKGSDKVDLVESYKRQIEGEIVGLCQEVVQLIDSGLYKQDDTDENQVFWLKMKGDYYRYAAEVGHQSSIFRGQEAYEIALKQAQNLPATSTNKLGLALNFSVFNFEILKKPMDACNLAQSAFDAALPELDSLQEQQYKEATNILGLIRDNLTIWTGEEED